jgi:cytochrome c
MDSFELNKIIGAILGTLLFVMGVGFLAEAIYHPVAAGPGYALPEPEGGDHSNGGGEETPAISIGTLLAAADATLGADQAKKCGTCHDLSAANANKTGPGLYDVVERVIGSHEGFAYSAVLAEHQAAGDIWTYENLNQFLLSPKGFAPGTKMTFAGVKNDEERANIIAFLSTLSASPKPFPPAEEAAPSEEPAASGEVPPSEATVDAVSSVPSGEAVETPTGTSNDPAGATATTPAGGDETAVSEPAMQASPVSSEASSAAQ